MNSAHTNNTSSSITAVVIGRAGSKGLPGKNAKDLAGRPMICHTIEDALQAELVDRVLVSTDGEAIASAAEAMGVPVISRPPELANDTATVDSAVRHAVDTSDDPADVFVVLYANVPIRPPELIDRAIRRLLSSGGDSVQSYSPVGKHHPYWMNTLDGENRVLPHVVNAVYRRQDLPSLLLPNGGVIAVTRASLFTVIEGEPHAFLGKDRRGIITPEGSVIDVDTPLDFTVAEAILSRERLETPA